MIRCSIAHLMILLSNPDVDKSFVALLVQAGKNMAGIFEIV